MAGTIRESVRLLTIWGGFVAKPGLLSGLKAGADTYDVITKLAKTPDPRLKTLGDRLADEAETVFRQYRDAPPDAEVLYAQMVEKGLPDARTIAGANLNAGEVVDRMLQPLTLSEHRTPAMQGLFRQVTEPVLAQLFGNPAFFADIEPAAIAEVLSRQDRAQEQLDKLVTQYGSLATAMESLTKVPRDQMEALALRFEIEGIYDRSDPDLRQTLELKAEEYRAYKAQIDGLDERVGAIANLKGAAQGAAEQLDFDEVEELLARVDEVETSIAAETKETRAANALLRGRADQAYEIFTSAAEAFRGLDILEMARRRDRYRRPLYRHGLRYGGTGLARAIDIARLAVEALEGTDHSVVRAGYQQNLALALQTQGSRIAGPEGAALLDEAVAANRAALHVFTEADHPVNWAITQQNLGMALWRQGERTTGPEGAELLAEAVTAYRAALRVRTEEDYPVDWATTQQNLAVALNLQGIRAAGPEGAELLGEAVAAHRAALRVFSDTDNPEFWAWTQQNIGIALMTQGERTAGPGGTELLARAVAAYRAALRVLTENDHPVQWATTRQNLGIALQNQGDRTAGPEGADLLSEAVTAYRAALRVRTAEDHPAHWAMTQTGLAIAEEAIANHDTTAEPRPHLEAALAHVEATLTVYDPEHMAYDHEKSTRLRDGLRKRLAALDV